MSIDFDSDAVGVDALNLNSANGAALLEALGVSWGSTFGEFTIAEARRAVIRAKNRSSYAKWERPAVDEPRYITPAFTADDLRDRIDRFADLVEKAAAAGARFIRWS